MAYGVVFFDLGGVVFDIESDRLVLQVAQLLGRSFEDVQVAIYHDELLLPFELGRIAPQTYYEGLKRTLDLPWTFEQFAQAWNGIFQENPGVTRLMHQLRHDHKLVALTNTNILHIEHIRTTMPSWGLFHDGIASCEVGVRKPDPAIYALALQRAGVPPAEAIYVDDRPELIEAGRRAGLTAIRFENSRQLEQDLRAIGVGI